MRINTAFFGTSDKSIPLLENLKEKTNLYLCITKTDRQVGRNKEIQQTLVKRWAIENHIDIVEIERMDTTSIDTIVQALIEKKIKVGIVADFSFIIPNKILSTPPKGLINIHFSKLPKYRGASPVQHTIMNGDTTTAITYMIMNDRMDEGNVLRQIPFEVKPNSNTQTLYEELFRESSKHLDRVIYDFIDGKIQPIVQDENQATYCFSKTKPKSTLIYKDDAYLNWSDESNKLERLIRAFYPWPVAWSYINDLKIDGYRLKPSVKENTKIKIIKAKLENNKLVLEIVQPENKNKMDFKSFLNGYFEKII